MENLVNMHNLLKKEYSGKKVFITGHTGFKGSWLTQILLLCGAEIKGYSLEPEYDNSLYDLLGIHKNCKTVLADIRDLNKLKAEICSFSPDFIFHLAAQPLVRRSYDNPCDTFQVNVNGTINLLESVRYLNHKCQVILITTDKVYHNNEWLYPYRESDRLGGYDPYSASKACTELAINCYRNSFFNITEYSKHSKSIAVARAGNVIGGGDWSLDRLIPDIIKSLSINEIITLRNPTAVRPWQHVLEPLVGYLQLGISLVNNPIAFSQAYNFGPHNRDAISVESMVNLAIKKWGTGSYQCQISSDAPHEAGLLKLDISKAISEIGWQPKLDATAAVAYTIDWYKCFFESPEEIADYTNTQILDFISNG